MRIREHPAFARSIGCIAETEAAMTNHETEKYHYNRDDLCQSDGAKNGIDRECAEKNKEGECEPVRKLQAGHRRTVFSFERDVKSAAVSGIKILTSCVPGHIARRGTSPSPLKLRISSAIEHGY